MSILEFLFPPGHCPQPGELPEDIDDLLPPPPAGEAEEDEDTDVPPPAGEIDGEEEEEESGTGPAPEPEALPEGDTRTEADAEVAAITQAMEDTNDCEDCEPCLAVLGGIGVVYNYSSQDKSEKGYRYQHDVVNWFYCDPVSRFIMEWNWGGVRWDGLDPTRGTMLASRAIGRAEYDPAGRSRCYLIECKSGHDWYFHYNAFQEMWSIIAPASRVARLQTQLNNQVNAVSSVFPEVALVWVCSSSRVVTYMRDDMIAGQDRGVISAVLKIDISDYDRL